MSVAAVITAQHDLRFLASTVGAVLAQRMLPGMIVIADCTGQIEQPMQMTFDVIHSSQDVLTEVPEAKTVRVILVGVKQAASFMDAVTRAMDQIGIDAGIRALWTLHDDSRPADDRCFETLLDAWRNTPTAALLGAKQLDWQAKNLHNVGLYAGHHDVVSLVVDGEPDQEQYDGRQDVLSVSLSGALVPLATLRAFEGLTLVRHLRGIHGPVPPHMSWRWACRSGSPGSHRPQKSPIRRNPFQERAPCGRRGRSHRSVSCRTRGECQIRVH